MSPLARRLVGIAVLVLVTAVASWWFITRDAAPTAEQPAREPVATSSTPLSPGSTEAEIIGRSVEDRPIFAHTFGTGPVDVLFVGGIHGGYEWNSVLLAWELIDHLTEYPELVPSRLTVHIIPVLNPDGLALVTKTAGRFTTLDVPSPSERVAAGRFNANGVDLNRNFDCNWAPESTWRGQVVSAGSAPFSEPEAATLRDYVQTIQPVAAAFWHSQANTVYGSACNGGVLPQTTALGSAYATAARYRYVDFFDAYPITGDVEGWLASLGIPAVTVELESYQATEWERNWAGVQAWFTALADE